MSAKTKTIFIILVGIILVAIGIFVSILLIKPFQTTMTPEVADEVTVKTSVVVVTRDLLLGDTISGSDVRMASVPIEVAPRDTLASLEEAVGKIVKTDLVQGEMLLAHNLANPTNNNKDLGFILSDEHVLFAFPAEDLMSRENMIQRGDIINIFATFDETMTPVDVTTTTGDPAEDEKYTYTVNAFQKVGVTALVLEILEEGSNTNVNLLGGGGGEESTTPVTRIRAYLLALDPQDALVLKHLKDIGAIFDIVLRSPTSTLEFDLTPISKEYIIEFYGLELLP